MATTSKRKSTCVHSVCFSECGTCLAPCPHGLGYWCACSLCQHRPRVKRFVMRGGVRVELPYTPTRVPCERPTDDDRPPTKEEVRRVASAWSMKHALAYRDVWLSPNRHTPVCRVVREPDGRILAESTQTNKHDNDEINPNSLRSRERHRQERIARRALYERLLREHRLRTAQEAVRLAEIVNELTRDQEPKRGRKPIGSRAMTGAERKAKHDAKKRKEIPLHAVHGNEMILSE